MMADPVQNQMQPPPPPAPIQPPVQNNQQQQQQQQPLVAPVNQPANNVPIVQAQVVQGADGCMAVKVQQTKLPGFWGQKDKDSIMANEFVKRVDKIMSANNWSDKIAFNNFGPALRRSANTWLDSQVTIKKISGDQECWTIMRPFFKEVFATDKLILDRLAHMAMRPTENIRVSLDISTRSTTSFWMPTRVTPSHHQSQFWMRMATSVWLTTGLTMWPWLKM
jgi:hypothetical protein